MPFLFFLSCQQFCQLIPNNQKFHYKKLVPNFYKKHQIKITTAASKSYYSVYSLTLKKNEILLKWRLKNAFYNSKNMNVSTIFVRSSNVTTKKIANYKMFL